MYANAQSHVRVGEGYSEEFEVKLSVYQGLVLSLLLFIVLEALLCQLCLKPCYASSALGSPGRTSMPVTLLSSLNHLRNVSGGS